MAGLARRHLPARGYRRIPRGVRLHAAARGRARDRGRREARRPRARHGRHRRGTEARPRVDPRRAARGTAGGEGVRRRGRRVALRRRRVGARRGRGADGFDPRAPRGRHAGGALGAVREPAQDAPRDGRGHPRRDPQARRAAGGAALAHVGGRVAAARVRAGGARSLRAAGEPARGLAAQVGARGPVAPGDRARDLQADREADRRAPARPPALHRGRDRDAEARARVVADRRRRDRPPEAHLQHLDQDAPQAVGHRDALRHPRGAHPRRRRQGVLHGARHRASPVDASARRVRRLHRQAEGERLPVAAHRRDRPGGEAAGGADPHARDAPALGVRRRGALALQGRRVGPPRPGVRGPHRVAAAGARLEGRDRRHERMARRVQAVAVHRHDLRADAPGQGRRPARGRDAGRLRVRRAHRTSATAAAARRSTATWCRSTRRSRTDSASRC